MVEHYFCPGRGMTTYGVSPVFVDLKPDPEKKQIAVNARLLDDVDIGVIPVTVIDGKNLW